MNPIKVEYNRDTVFIDSENSNRYDPHWLLLNLPDKVQLNRSDEFVALSNLSI